MRRTPLFGYDGNLGIPIIPPKSTTSQNSSSSGKNTNAKYGSYHSDYSNSKVGLLILKKDKVEKILEKMVCNHMYHVVLSLQKEYMNPLNVRVKTLKMKYNLKNY